MTRPETLTRSVASLAGIGSRSVKKLEKMGVHTLQDLIFHLPYRYEDRTKIIPISTLLPGMTALTTGTVEFTDVSRKGRRSVICRISDQTAHLTLRFFYFSAQQRLRLSPGTLVSCFGEIRYGFYGLEIIHPEYKIISATDVITETNLTPIYPLTDGLRQTTLRKVIKQALSICLKEGHDLIDWLPETILNQYHFPSLTNAILSIHAPEENINSETLALSKLNSIKRLAFEELLAHHLTLLQNKTAYKKWQAPVFKDYQLNFELFLNQLPFQLTQAQNRVIDEITADCNLSSPMLRLIQGDVGSGKTIVAAFATLLAFSSKYQVAIMAPTELLAEQHYINFSLWFELMPINIVFLTGQLKGKTKKKSLEHIQNGQADIIIGTHALFQDQVNFKNLGLIIIDEQHRFGVHQRLALREKGQQDRIRPHQLIMTATPIPRTLAMLQYSDLDISIIDELPPGRQPVTTCAIPSERREKVMAKINQWTAKKHQTFWVCTLIEESEKLECEAAKKTAEHLASLLPDVRIALIHGRMKSSEKESIMQAFKNHESDVLVATTVIEVGVDIPNANLMIIENSDRLGLSQLHQLRGRVGRGAQESYCLLMYQSPLSDVGRQRLGILRENHDGFVIAEKDLTLRGPGDLLGTRQTGQIQLKVANLNRDIDLIKQVHTATEVIYKEHPDIIQPIIERWLGQATHYSEV